MRAQRILVLGQGGREHALIQAMAMDKALKLYALPGSDGMSHQAELVPLTLQDPERVVQWAQEQSIHLVVIGPDQAMADGYGDLFRQVNIPVFGPNRDGAQLEWSKIFAKEFMLSAGIPTAKSFVVSSVEECLLQSQNFSAPWVLKADGLALGKGVFICKTNSDLELAAQKIFKERAFGSSGDRALLEEFIGGEELSLHAITNGKNYEIFPMARDHKRLLDHNEGPNTGGMGTLAPIAIEDSLLEKVKQQILEPTMNELQKRKLDYRGILFIGLMVKDGDPYVLEYNTRFGDPETQVFMPLLKGSWSEVFEKVAQGVVPVLEWHKEKAVACVVLAAPGYPEAPQKGLLIDGVESAGEDSHAYILHAGTQKEGGRWLTKGGRVLNCIGVGHDISDARQKAYRLADKIHFDGKQFRKDI